MLEPFLFVASRNMFQSRHMRRKRASTRMQVDVLICGALALAALALSMRIAVALL